MKKFVLKISEVESIRKSSDAVASSDRSNKGKRDDLKTAIEVVLQAKKDEGLEIPIKLSEEAKEWWKVLYSSVYPSISAKKQKDHTDIEKSKRVALSRAWNASLVPAEKEMANCIDCFQIDQVSKALNIPVEDGELFKHLGEIVKRAKARFDFETPEGNKMFNEAVRHAESEAKSEMERQVREKELELEALRKKAQKVVESYKVA